MVDCKKKENKCSNVLLQVKLLNRNTRCLLICCLFAILTASIWQWSRMDSDDRDLADVTRPPQGFEAEEIALELPSLQDPAIATNPEPEKPSPSAQELSSLKEQQKQLQLLLKEKDDVIAELTRQLQEKNTPTPPPPTTPPSFIQTPIESDTPFQPEEHAEGEVPRTHTVKKGETLSEISRQYYGTGAKWREIYDANREKIGDKNQVRVGTELVIPKS